MSTAGRRDWIGVTDHIEASKGEPEKLRKIRSVALRRVAMAQLIGWPAMAQSFQRDADRVAELLGVSA